MMKKTWMIVALGALLTSFMAKAEKLDAGPWRFELRLGNVGIPFIIEFKEDKNGITGVLRNGKELISLNDIRIGKETISIPLNPYEVSLEMDPPKEGTMAGFLIRHNKNPKIKTAVFALKGEDERFPEEKSKAQIDLTGKWAIKLEDEDDKVSSGVIVFEQKGSVLNGSILTPTGDYRYMEGFVSGNKFEAASFDGVYNYVIRGRLKDHVLEAKILSNHTTRITGSKDASAALPNEYAQTQVSEMDFSFPNLKGEKISLKDKRFKNKPVIVQFFGSWCPNCLDETNFLVPWYNQNKKRGVEVIALAFERSLDHAEAKKQLTKYQAKMNIPYPLLIAGYTSEDKPMDKIKGLKNFISFPTTVFLNKKHEVVKVHAGFTGPSTGEFFENWKKEFNATVTGMLK